MQIGYTYRIRTKEGINFTGKVIEKSDSSIRIITIRNEDLILDDEHLDWAKRNEGEQ